LKELKIYNFIHKIKMMQSKVSRSLLNKACSNGFNRMMGTRGFSSDSVTYEMKDLILDPDQKGQPVWHLYRLE
jgi:hypothetical protein